MLKTLLKHEMRATAKTFVWLYIAFAAIVVVNALVNPMTSVFHSSNVGADMEVASSMVPNAIQGIAMMLYVLSLVAMGIVTFVIVILRFFRNLLGDEGYLMMTLPVSREQNILSKLLIAVFWNVCTCILIILSLLLMIASAGIFSEFAKGLQEFFASDLPSSRWIALGIATALVATFTGVMMLYAAMGMGPNLLKNRVGGSILSYILIYVASQFVVVGVMWGVAAGTLGPNVITQTIILNGTNSAGIVVEIVDMILIATIVSEAAIGVGCWFLTRFMLTRKLNLA